MVEPLTDRVKITDFDMERVRMGADFLRDLINIQTYSQLMCCFSVF